MGPDQLDQIVPEVRTALFEGNIKRAEALMPLRLQLLAS